MHAHLSKVLHSSNATYWPLTLDIFVVCGPGFIHIRLYKMLHLKKDTSSCSRDLRKYRIFLIYNPMNMKVRDGWFPINQESLLASRVSKARASFFNLGWQGKEGKTPYHAPTVTWFHRSAVLLYSPVFCVLQLLNSYIMTSRELDLNTAACRLLQNIMPGLESGVVFQEKVLHFTV